MQVTFIHCLPVNQATWAIFISRIFFYNLARSNNFDDFIISDITFCHLPNSMLSEKYLILLNGLPDFQNNHDFLL